ncbi:hypothetical protein M636_13045 [Vibrio parahaemolyticus O1:K33 str. CDC_K4557]|nr:hypothetical protein M636_13045 [Vibrio parahaemolyticus O1:K33 str. CDC_K4557]
MIQEPLKPLCYRLTFNVLEIQPFSMKVAFEHEKLKAAN